MDDYSNSSNSEFNDLFEANDSISRGEAKRMVAEEVQRTLRDISVYTSQAQASVSNAIREVTAKHPDFQARRPQMLATLEEIPILKDAIGAAENNPQLAPTLVQMYEVAYLAAAGSNATGTAATPSESSKPGTQDDLSSEGVQYAAALASQKIDLGPENRKDLINSLERKGVLDVEF